MEQVINSKPPSFSPEGWHLARCIGFIQIGTVWIVDKWQSQCRILWELPNDKRVFNQGDAAKPKMISKEYASSFYGKSWLKKHLSSWLGEQETMQLERKFDPYVFVGEPCYIQIAHKMTNRNAWYEEVVEVKAVAVGESIPPQFIDSKVLLYQDFNLEVFVTLPEYIKDKIMRSKEWASMDAVEYKK